MASDFIAPIKKTQSSKLDKLIELQQKENDRQRRHLLQTLKLKNAMVNASFMSKSEDSSVTLSSNMILSKDNSNNNAGTTASTDTNDTNLPQSRNERDNDNSSYSHYLIQTASSQAKKKKNFGDKSTKRTR
jgi:hypothetical protein